MPKTVPNQRVIRVHRERASSDFLGIKNERWMAASRILGATALRLYLYLASNADNYLLALSPLALERDVGMPRSTFYDQFRKLVNCGYLVQTGGNQYDFYEADSDFFTQPGKLFRLMSPEQQQVLFENTAAAMNGVPDFIKERHAKHCYQCDPAYGEGVAKALGMNIDFSDVK